MRVKRFLVCLFLVIFFSYPAFAAERRTPIVDAVSKARDAVVNIRTEQIVERRSNPFFGFGEPIFEQFFEDMLPTRSYTTQSLGSGVIIVEDGHILTNAHVVNKASKIFVALTNQKHELEARLIGADERVDLAVLRIVKEGSYPFLKPARSDDLMLGETVIAIGNPLGLGHSITTGIVSSLKRRVQIDRQLSSVFIQTDALINPGNSGGPLINVNGELVGINTAIARQAQGIGFSIPIDTAKRVVNDLIRYGRVRRGFLGVIAGSVSSNFVRSFGEGGVLVDEVLPRSPAEKAELEMADVILFVDDVSVTSTDQYHSLMQTYTPGDSLELVLLRGAQKIRKKVVLSSLPEGYEMTYTQRIFGFDLKDGRHGPVVHEVIDNSAADRVGIQAGDLIAKVEGNEIENLKDYRQAIEDRLGQVPLTFTVVRDNFGYLIELP